MIQNDFINMAEPQNSRFTVKHRPKLEILPKMIPNIGISPGFWLTEEGNDISNLPSKW